MKLYDISQEVFHCRVFPGDEAPSFERTVSIANGGVCNLTVFRQCAHNGTHVDAPKHFLDDGKAVDELDLDRMIGMAKVVSARGAVTKDEITRFMTPPCERLLLKVECYITLEAAKELNKYDIKLIGNESQTVGPIEDPVPVHLELLGKEVVLLEGIVLQDVPEGEYLLNAAPLNLGGADGAPCRAILIQL